MSIEPTNYESDETLIDRTLNALTEGGPGLGGIVMLKEPNPLDGNTPLEVPLIIVGTGLGSGGVSYNVTGWDKVGTEAPYYILRAGDAYHVMRQSHAHAAFFPKYMIERRLWDAAEDF